MVKKKKKQINPPPISPILAAEQRPLYSDLENQDCRIDKIFQAYDEETKGMDRKTLVDTQIERERRLRKSLLDNKRKNYPKI